MFFCIFIETKLPDDPPTGPPGGNVPVPSPTGKPSQYPYCSAILVNKIRPPTYVIPTLLNVSPELIASNIPHIRSSSTALQDGGPALHQYSPCDRQFLQHMQL